MDWPSLYAIGAFIQGSARTLASRPPAGARPAAHVYVGTGLGNIAKLYDASIELHHAQRRWDRFWSEPERNTALRMHLATHGSDPVDGVPQAPAAAAAAHADPDAREAAVHAWQRYWADRSPELAQYLGALAAIEKTGITGSVESGKVHVIRARDAARAKLQQRRGAPDAPWEVSADVVWNLHNTPAAQVSMLATSPGWRSRQWPRARRSASPSSWGWTRSCAARPRRWWSAPPIRRRTRSSSAASSAPVCSPRTAVSRCR
jgi:hypothetical protein